MKSRIALLTLVALAGSILGSTMSLAAPMGTAFTYQGRFNASGNPANGAYDFEFRLFDAATLGNQVGSTVLKDDLTVSDGYFTTTLDFGSGRFTGDARWLAIAVRPGAETGAYTAMTPRHELTANPNALYADRTNGISVSNGNVGIGTTSPEAKLHVDGVLAVDTDTGNQPFRVMRLGPASPAQKLEMWVDDNHAYIRSEQDEDAGYGGIVFQTDSDGTSGSGGFYFQTKSGVTFMAIDEGKVGIGTTTPENTLHVLSTGTGYIANFQATVPGAAIRLKDSLTTGAGEAMARCADHLDLRTNDTPRLTVLGSSGYVGIGTGAPTQMLHVGGNIQCVQLYQSSDEQLKTDIQPLTGALDKIGQVRGVSFRWNEKAGSLGARTGQKQIGVLAQELEQVFPEMVTTPKPATVEELSQGYSAEMLTPQVRERLQADADATNYKAVNYSQLTVVLLEAVKELKAENDTLRQRIEALEAKAQ